MPLKRGCGIVGNQTINFIVEPMRIIDFTQYILRQTNGSVNYRGERQKMRRSMISRRTILKGLAGSICMLPITSFEGLGLELTQKTEFKEGAEGKSSVESTIQFDSSDSDLVNGFHWAKNEALTYVRNNGTIGPWYYASIAGRNAFCMRDTSHMSTGAQLLGLGNRNYTMLHEFASHISQAQKWCSWWEITGDGTPAPVDYKSESDFWFNLPANFDVLDACYRQWLWSRNKSYVNDSAFLNFYYHTVTSYVKAWENGENGLMEVRSKPIYMGIPTYDESNYILIGADLIAAQYVAYRDYAQILRIKGQAATAKTYDKKASELRKLYNDKWWNSSTQSFYSYIDGNGKFETLNTVTTENELPLYFGLVENGIKTKSALDKLEQAIQDDSTVENGVMGGVESMSYLPNIFFKYGRTEQAYHILRILTDPKLKRRSYPEVSFTVVGNIGSGLMGIHPLMYRRTIQTLSQLPEHNGSETRAELSKVPVGENVISVWHRGNKETRFVNESGPDLHWRASFMGNAEKLFADKKSVLPRKSTTEEGVQEVWVDVIVPSGESRIVHK